MAAKISTLLHPSRIALHLGATEGTAALDEAVHLLDGHPEVTNFTGLLADIHERAKAETICLGNDIALPHARTAHVKKLVVAVGRAERDLNFEDDSAHARLFFVVATPENQPADYLAVVGALCRVLKQPADRDALLNAATPQEFIQAIIDVEDRGLTAPIFPRPSTVTNR